MADGLTSAKANYRAAILTLERVIKRVQQADPLSDREVAALTQFVREHGPELLGMARAAFECMR